MAFRIACPASVACPLKGILRERHPWVYAVRVPAERDMPVPGVVYRGWLTSYEGLCNVRPIMNGISNTLKWKIKIRQVGGITVVVAKQRVRKGVVWRYTKYSQGRKQASP